MLKIVSTEFKTVRYEYKQNLEIESILNNDNVTIKINGFNFKSDYTEEILELTINKIIEFYHNKIVIIYTNDLKYLNVVGSEIKNIEFKEVKKNDDIQRKRE